MLRNLVNGAAVASLLLGQFATAVNFFDVGSVFYFIAGDFHQDVGGLGLVTTALLLGVGLFQVPAGVIASTQGPRRTFLCGLLIVSAAALASPLTGQAEELAALRFVIGMGVALTFPPGVMMTMRYFRKGAEGLGLGLYTGMFAIGGAVATFGWAVMGSEFGWRASLVAGAAVSLLAAFVAFRAIPNEPTRTGRSISFSDVGTVVKNGRLALIVVAMVSMQIGANIVGNFMVFYLETQLNYAAYLAGIVGGLSQLAGFVGSPIAGRLFDTSKSPNRIVFFAGLLAAVGLGMFAAGSFYVPFVATVVVGMFTMIGITMGFALTRATLAKSPQHMALGISWVNAVSLLFSVWIPIFFSLIALRYGYAPSWMVAAVGTVVLVAPILALKASSSLASEAGDPGDDRQVKN